VTSDPNLASRTGLVLASTSAARRLSAYRLPACLLAATGSIEGKERALRSGRAAAYGIPAPMSRYHGWDIDAMKVRRALEERDNTEETSSQKWR